MQRTARNNRGFTLVELIVVMAIMALLAGIVFPVFGRVRENARRSACMSNLYQIGVALKLYRMDYNRQDAPWLSSMIASGHLGNQSIFLCPDDDSRGTVWRWLGAPGYDADFAEVDDYHYSGNNIPNSYMYEFCAAPCSWDPRKSDGTHDAHAYDGQDAATLTAETACPDGGRAHAVYSQTAGQPLVAYPAEFWSWRDVKMVQVNGRYCPKCRETTHGETQIKKADNTTYMPSGADHGDTGDIYGYGDDVPVVRCGHHTKRDGMNLHNYINLSFGGRAYISKAKWEEEH